MARIKHTKTELKRQRDALRLFERYLPTLQLKKQQLQMEVRNVETRRKEKAEEDKQARSDLDPWVKLFSEPFPLEDYLQLVRVEESVANIAGVNIPVLEKAVFNRQEPDLFATPPWIDAGLRVLEQLIRLRLEHIFLKVAHERLLAELRTTTQRVNLFEKVKIPEARENIRTIRIFLGDQQTAEVARGKIAKGKAPAESLR